ncbi:MAG TPA: dihydrofolate reductase family protein, partial [Methylophilaceae bacterium]|nr:dihydrofolate reductase family protein [Methylophilaceae bacterium]
REINEVLVEAGARFNGTLLEMNLIDEFLLYYAPVLLGDAARGMLGMTPLTAMSQRRQLEILDIRHVGADLRLRVRPQT